MPGHPPTPMPASAHNARGKRRARTAAAATSGASWSGNVLEMRRSKKSLTRPQKKKISGPCRDWHFPCATEFKRRRWALTPFPGAWPQQTGLLEGWLAGDLRAAETADRRRRGNVWTRACPQGAAGRLPAAKPGLGVGRRYRAQPAHCSLRRLLPQARCVPPSHPPSHVIIVPMPHCLCLTPNKQPSCPGAVHAAGASGGPVSAVDTGVPATCHDDAFHSDTACRDGPGFPPLHLDTWVPQP